MKAKTLRFEAERVGEWEAEAEKRDVSVSQIVRERLDEREETLAELEDLRERVEELKTEVERVHEDKRLIIADREEKKGLVRYVEGEKEARERRENAPVWTRAKWWVFGQKDE